jgi:CheY-like chemotaxis protein
VLLDLVGEIEKEVAGDLGVAHGPILDQIAEDVRNFRDLVILDIMMSYILDGLDVRRTMA